MLNQINENDKTKKICLKIESKGMRDIQAISKYRQYISKKRKRIQELYERSVANQIYIFPRSRASSTDSSSVDHQNQENNQKAFIQDLKKQNKHDKNCQVASQNLIKKNQTIRKQGTEVKISLLNDKSKRLYQKNENVNSSNISLVQMQNKKSKSKDKYFLGSNNKLFSSNKLILNTSEDMKKTGETIIVSFRGKEDEQNHKRIRSQIN